MTYYEWEDESIATLYTMVSHFGINHPKSVNNGNSISDETKSIQLEIIKINITS